MSNPILILPLSKAGWSDEARAAALAARAAKAKGQDPKVAGAVAKRLVGQGMTRQEAVTKTKEIMAKGRTKSRATREFEARMERQSKESSAARKARVAAASKKLRDIDEAKVSKFYGEMKSTIKRGLGRG